MNQTNRKFGSAKLVVLIASATTLGVCGFAAYKIFFARPGETAVGLIPSDAGVVITLDTNPSPNQIKAFNSISTALKSEGVDQKVTEGLSGLLGKAGIAEELRPYVQSSFAVGIWPPEKGTSTPPHGVMLLAISDPAAVSAILGKIGTAGASNTFNVKGMTLGVVGSYLAMSSDAATIARVQSVKDGKEASVATIQEYQLARSGLPGDANLMAFISPTAMKAIAANLGSKGAMDTTPWMSFSATIRDDGFQLDYRAPVNTASMPSLAKVAGGKGIDITAYRHLPAGAYGVVAYSAIGNYYAITQDSLKKAGNDTEEQMNKGVADFEKATGLSIPKDLVPALMGNTMVAIYPAADGDPKNADGVLVVDNSNGGAPVALSAKIPSLIEHLGANKPQDKVPHFVKTEENGAVIYALDAESQAKMDEGLSGHANAATPPDVSSVNDPAFAQIHSQPAHIPVVPPIAKDKTITWAEVDGCVVIASSKGMLEKAIATFKGGPSLATDTAFAPTFSRLAGNQAMMIVSMRRVMNALRPYAEGSMPKGSGPSFDDIANLFGDGDAAMYMGGKLEGNVGSGTWFIPLDFARAAALIHKATSPQLTPPVTPSAMEIR